MCGFVGYILSGHTSRPEPARWSEVIRHRGPDQGGHVADGEFGIGTRRLAILDLSETGSQPMRGERYTLGFNGEIYNHMEIRAALEGEAPVAWRSRSDTETVLRAVERWGVSAALARLNGMYALALFDAHERALTLARDPLGIKPLLYLERPDGILFASELKALRPYSAGRISADGMALYLLFGFVPAPFSLLADVQKLLPGEVLRICQGARRRHFVQPLAWDTAPSPLPTITERMAQLRAEVSAAVSRQLLSDVPVGFFLSGGVDSTIVAAVAARIASGLTSFSIRPEGAAADPGAQVDADLAASFAHDHGFAHHEISLRPEILTDDLASLIDLLDEPTAELYFAAEVLLSRRARAAGVAVVLTGHGGDEVFLGYPSYSAQIKGERYDGIPFFGPALRTLATLPIVPRDARDNMRGAAEIWRRPFLECYARFSATQFNLEEAAALAGVSRQHLSALVDEVLTGIYAATERLTNGRPCGRVERFARMDLLLKVAEHYNMRLDRATMAASVEARVPLQDLALVGFVAGLPASDLMIGGLKGLLRHACADLIPPEVARRPKQNFQAPMRSWVGGTLGPWVRDHLAALPAERRAMLGLEDMNPRTTRQSYRAWSLGLLEAWRATGRLTY